MNYFLQSILILGFLSYLLTFILASFSCIKLTEEIVSENDFFDFEAKYEGKSKEITPARISDNLAKKVSERTIEIYQLLELNGIARVDFIIMDNEPYIIEANTVPGLSEESIIPQQARCQGISLSELFNQSVEFMFHGK